METIGAGMIILLGIALLLFPEPATTGIGVLLVLIGGGMWFSKWRSASASQRTETEEEMPTPNA